MKITWTHDSGEIPWPPSFDKKVDIFYHRTLGWQLHILKVSKLLPDQFSLFRPTFLALSGTDRWGCLDELSRAICLQNAWRRDFMTGRPAAHWTDFGVLPLQAWVRLVARLSITK